MDYRAGIRDVLGTRFELRLGDAMDSEIDRRWLGQHPARAARARDHVVEVPLPRRAPPGRRRPGGRHPRCRRGRPRRQGRSTPGPGRPAPRCASCPPSSTSTRPGRWHPTALACCWASTSAPSPPWGSTSRATRTSSSSATGSPASPACCAPTCREVTRLHTPETAQLFLVDYRRANLGEFPEEWVADYATNAQTAAELAGGLAEFLKDRLPGGRRHPRPAAAPSVVGGQGGVRRRRRLRARRDEPGQPARARCCRCSPRPSTSGCTCRSPGARGGAGRLYDAVVTALRDLAQPGIAAQRRRLRRARSSDRSRPCPLPGPGADAHP